MYNLPDRGFIYIILSIYVVFYVLTVIHAAPKSDGDSFVDEVFEYIGYCADLETQGYEGYECVPMSRCENGYIINDIVDGSITPFNDHGDDVNEFDASKYECPSIRSFSDYEDELTCCRKSEFYGSGVQ